MVRLGLNVPPGFIIATHCCHDFLRRNGISDNLNEEILHAVKELEHATGKTFGLPSITSPKKLLPVSKPSTTPLLVSVRSGAPVSMPGMMNTILNVGCNDTRIEELIRITNNPAWAYDTYRRFLQVCNMNYLIPDKHFVDQMI